MDKHQQIIALRLAGIFTRYYGYDVLRIDPTTNNISVANPTHPHYPTINIVQTPLVDADDRSKEMVEALNNLSRKKRDIKLLTFSFERENYENDTHLVVNLNEQNTFNEQLISTFPKLKELSWEVAQPEIEIKKAVDVLNQATLKHRKQRIWKNSITNTKGALVLISISVVMMILGYFISSLAQYETTFMIFLGGLYVPMIQGAYEFHRFLTAGFLHVDLIHLFVNMMAIYNLSVLLEKVYGTKTFVWTTLISILGGNLVVYIADTQAAVSVGMSTGIYGLLGLFVVYLVETGLIKTPLFRRQLLLIVGVNLIINFLPNVSWLGHLGGFITGVIIGILLIKKIEFQAFRKNTVVATLLLVLSLGYLALQRPMPKQLYVLTDHDVMSVARKLNLNGYADYLETKMTEYYFQGEAQ